MKSVDNLFDKHRDDSIMDRQIDDAFRPEGFYDISEDVGLLAGPLYEEGLDIPLRSFCIDVVLIDYPQQYTSTRYPSWIILRLF